MLLLSLDYLENKLNKYDYINIEYLLNNSNLTINIINKMLNDYNGTEIYSITLMNKNDKEKIITQTKMFLKFKYNINISYSTIRHNDGRIYFDYEELPNYLYWNDIDIKDVKIIYNLFNKYKIKKLNNIIAFDNINNLKNFVNEFKNLK